MTQNYINFGPMRDKYHNFIRRWQDLPDPVMKDGVLTIIPKPLTYTQVEDISCPYPLASPGDGETVTFKAINNVVWTYEGTDACFRDYDSRGNVEARGQVEFHAPNGLMWDYRTDGGEFSFQATNLSRFRNCLGLGNIFGPDIYFNHHNGSITGFGTGLDVRDCLFFEMNTVFLSSDGLQPTEFVKISGDQTSGAINFILITTDTVSGQTLFNLDKSIESGINEVLLDIVEKDGPFLGEVFASGSLTQKTPKVVAQGSEGLFPNSTIKGKLNIIDNSLLTTVSNPNTPTNINTTWSNGNVEERICFRDVLTFDNITNVCSTSSSHGMVNDDIIKLKEGGGLPIGLSEKFYYLINVTPTTFQLSDTLLGPVVEFSSNGTPTNYYCHETGISVTGLVVSTSINTADLHINGWVAIAKSGSSVRGVTRIIHIGAEEPFTETLLSRGSIVTIHNNADTSSQISDIVTLLPGEGIRIDYEAIDNTDNVTITDALLSISKA